MFCLKKVIELVLELVDVRAIGLADWLHEPISGGLSCSVGVEAKQL